MNNQPTQQPIDSSQFGQYSDWAKSQLDRGVSPDVINQTLQQNKLSTTPEKKSNWLQDLLPTIGGVVAPIVGAALAPETGGLSLLASAVLSGAGGAAGQVAKNVSMGENPIDQNVLTSGIENATGGLAGGVLGKLGGSLAKNVVAPIAEKTVPKLVQGQAVKGALTAEDAQYLAKNGVTDLSQMNQIHPHVTGPEGALNMAVENSLSNAADTSGLRMDLSGLGRAASNLPGEAVQNHAINAGIGKNTPATSNVQDFVENTLQRYNPNAIVSTPAKGGKMLNSFDNGVLNSQHPLDVLNITRDFDKRAGEWMSSRSPDTQLQGKALSNLSNELKDNLYGPDTAIGKMGITDQVRQQAIADLAPVQKINPQYYAAKVNEITNAQTLGDLRSAQAVDVRASQALNATANQANETGGIGAIDMAKMAAPGIGGSIGGPAGFAAGMVPTLLSTPTADKISAGVLQKLSNVAGGKTAEKLIPTLTRSGAIVAANLPNMGGSPTSPTNPSAIPTGQVNQGGQPMQGQQPDLQSYVNSLQALSVLDPTHYGSMGAGLTGSAFPQLQANQALQSEAAALPSTFGGAGGAQGIGGIPSVLSSLIPGTEANTYQGQAAVMAAQLAKALGISEQAAMNLLPNLMQTSQGAGTRQGVLSGLTAGLPS